MVKNLPANAGDVSSIPGSGRSPEEGKATVFSILAWKNSMDKEKPGGSQRVRHSRNGEVA